MFCVKDLVIGNYNLHITNITNAGHYAALKEIEGEKRQLVGCKHVDLVSPLCWIYGNNSFQHSVVW